MRIAIAAAAVLAAGFGLGVGAAGGEDRPAWLSEATEKRLTANARAVFTQDPSAQIERAFVVRTAHQRVSEIGQWQSPGDHEVYVVELWGDMRLCHGAPAGGNPCERTDGLTVVYDARTLRTDDVRFGRLGAERLGSPYDLAVTR